MSGTAPNQPNQRRRRSSVSKLEYDRRLEQLAGLIAKGWGKSALYKVIFDQGWATTPYQAANYCRRALDWLARAAAMSREELRARVHLVYTRIIRSTPSDAIRLRALAQLCDLWGLNAPSEQLIGGVPGQPVELTARPAVLVLPDNAAEVEVHPIVPPLRQAAVGPQTALPSPNQTGAAPDSRPPAPQHGQDGDC